MIQMDHVEEDVHADILHNFYFLTEHYFMDIFAQTHEQSSVTARADFLAKVWAYFGVAIATAAVGAYFGKEIIMLTQSFYVPYGIFMVLMLTQGMWANSKTFAIPMFLLFAFASGIILYPTLAFAAMTGQISAVIQALAASAGLFFAAAIFGYTTKKDLSGMGQFLFFTMIGVFIAGIVNIFIGSSLVSFIISCISVVLFSAYTAYDLQAIKNGAYGSAIMAATHLYINIFALFTNLLNIFLNRD